MTETTETEETIPVDELTPEEASRIIHSHRKVRYGTACWPCRQRKVKCDNKQPCENCVKREHPQLCSYKPNRSSTSKNTTAAQNGQAKKRACSFSDGREESRKSERGESWPRTIGISTSLDDTESVGDRYLGQNSIPALLREQSSPIEKNDSVDIRRDMRSILGLDTSAPFPLMSSQHLHRLAQDISAELPSDREVMKLFRTYKEIPQPFWGFVCDIDDFESKLMVYLEDRSRNASTSMKSSRPVAASWLAILFAVLAVGSQYHESPYHIRTRDSQKYIQISFHFLRLGNFLLRPSFDSIQALLLTSFVLLNDMKAEASWALTGLTCRLAQSLGLQRATSLEGLDSVPPDAKAKETTRRKLWWTCVWHDTLTSLSFDRTPMTNFPSCDIPISPEATPGKFTYLEMMYHLIEIISRRLNPDATATSSYGQIVDNCEAVESLRRRSLPHMQDKDQCKTALHRLQYYAIRLHTSFVISVSCRPALKRTCEFDPKQKKELADRCKDNLTETVRMFLAMHQLSVIPTRSWAFTYHGLSSALLLGILCETKTDPEIRQLQGDLIAALSATAAKEASSPEPHIPVSDKDIELSGPLWRALTALKNIYEHGTVIPSALKREGDSSGGGSGTRTPIPPFMLANTSGGNLNSQLRAAQAAGDPREDAALAMAEMQNGASLQDFSTIPYSQALPVGMNLDGLGGIPVDQTQLMAPMDLYDSIWGASPDPWNSGVDAMNFDFMAQPPPGQPQQQFYF
ncbi:fungal specific transcription factor domain-containing protein [Pochonia chlamydosporia 170]|uniref:Fungal specific transcription factor domain-containing protein n=1 Tax=Pochonia chlamydosporia 170 TaxID=1380566 RepID=A0A179FWE7_METCM|nr:fungal specific transcription factor domain-containing protein [Pochonia chlamydosporia 170]OAQ69944.1 fungal specific transcription factor domain-containing protein [Pochonia chlamydosporia 170]